MQDIHSPEHILEVFGKQDGIEKYEREDK